MVRVHVPQPAQNLSHFQENLCALRGAQRIVCRGIPTVSCFAKSGSSRRFFGGRIFWRGGRSFLPFRLALKRPLSTHALVRAIRIGHFASWLEPPRLTYART